MDAADALLLPSRAEATPLVLLEAMSRELPWIATPTCGSAHDHAGGLVVPLRLFGEAIDFLARDAAARRDLGAAGRAHWQASYTWEVMGPRYARVLFGSAPGTLAPPPAAIAATDLVRARSTTGGRGPAAARPEPGASAARRRWPDRDRARGSASPAAPGASPSARRTDARLNRASLSSGSTKSAVSR